MQPFPGKLLHAYRAVSLSAYMFLCVPPSGFFVFRTHSGCFFSDQTSRKKTATGIARLFHPMRSEAPLRQPSAPDAGHALLCNNRHFMPIKLLSCASLTGSI